jgi:hypothetical protein
MLLLLDDGFSIGGPGPQLRPAGETGLAELARYQQPRNGMAAPRLSTNLSGGGVPEQ